MEYSPVPTKQFMTRFDRVEPLILDSTAMTKYKYCPRLYFFQIVLGFNPKETAPYFTFGSAYHKFREVLENTKDFKVGLLSGLAYWDKHQGDDPLPGKWDFMTRLRLMQSMKVAYEYWEKEKNLGQIEVIATEQPFNVEIRDGHFTSGRFDQIIRWNGKVWGRDFKTTSKDLKYYDRGITPNDQFTRYTFAESLLAGERVKGQIIEVLYNSAPPKRKPKKKAGELVSIFDDEAVTDAQRQKRDGPYIQPFIAERTDFEMADWIEDELQWRQYIQLSREKDRWPKNETGCSFCVMHSVCKLGSEGAQMSKLQSEFVIREWDNTKVGVID